MNGSGGAGGLVPLKITLWLSRRLPYPFKLPYLDTQEVFLLLHSCNEETEKDGGKNETCSHALPYR